MTQETYTKSDIEQMLEQLAHNLAKSHKRITLFVFGGAGLVMMHDLRDVTRDVDAYVPQYAQLERVSNAAQIVKHAFNDNNPKSWLDINPLSLHDYASRRDLYFTRIGGMGTSLQHFYVATPETQLIFKLMRFAPAEKDYDDMVALCTYLGIDDTKQLHKLWRELASNRREARRVNGYDFVENRWQYIQRHRVALLGRTNPLAGGPNQ